MGEELHKYETIIGFEVHIELSTKSKMFCGCKNDPFFAAEPNMYTCPVCLGLPGGLPVPNKKAIESSITLGLALGCTIAEESKFDRKNYFYPDLAKGYQISQYDQPFAHDGQIELRTQNAMTKQIRIRRVHMEEDTGKLVHATVDGKKVTLVDFNRSGVPLVEIVTEPDFRSIEDVDLFLKKLQQIIRYLGISGADLEKGSMRLEPSISLRTQNTEPNDQKNSQLPNYRVELKNINSFRAVRKSLEYEIARQTEILDAGELVVQQTRGWDEKKGATVAQREKEEANDYRYFPEPDIPPIRMSELQISKLRTQIPELPDEKRERFMQSYGLNEYDANLLTDTQALADFYEEAVKTGSSLTPKVIANWVINKKPNVSEVLPAEFVQEIKTATEVVAVSSDTVEKAIDDVLAHESKAVADYKSGKLPAMMFILGMVMKKLEGKGDKKEIIELLKVKLA